MNESNLCIVTTERLKSLVQNSEKRKLSRLPDESLWRDIDPCGKHVLQVFPLLAEFHFVRTFAMCKVVNQNDPAELWIDLIPGDWERLRKETNAK